MEASLSWLKKGSAGGAATLTDTERVALQLLMDMRALGKALCEGPTGARLGLRLAPQAQAQAVGSIASADAASTEIVDAFNGVLQHFAAYAQLLPAPSTP